MKGKLDDFIAVFVCVSVVSAIVNSSHTCWAELQLNHSERWHMSTENIELSGRSIEAAPAICICRGDGGLGGKHSSRTGRCVLPTD